MTPVQDAAKAQLAPPDAKASRIWVEGHLACQASPERKETTSLQAKSALQELWHWRHGMFGHVLLHHAQYTLSERDAGCHIHAVKPYKGGRARPRGHRTNLRQGGTSP